MTNEEFRNFGHNMVDWMADYFQQIESLPVKAQVEPGEIYQQLPELPPEEAESFSQIFRDFQTKILKGITHWQHPNFFAYFPANNSYPSILGEMLTATLGAQCMIWETSPAAAELEQKVMEWMKQMMGLPAEFTGVIQDTASTATLCALLTARESATDFQSNKSGLDSKTKFTVYCSTQTHSSIDKAIKIAGIGSDQLRKIPVDRDFAMRPDALEKEIQTDIALGFHPLCVVASIGTTSSTAIDPVKKIGEICQKHRLWLHVDGAYAGTAMLLPEKRWIIEGLELADSYVFNPHKWMFTNFDCSAYYVKDESKLIRTFEILPEYLKTQVDKQVNNYRDWGIQLGRRFRALKLWFVIRSFGVKGLQKKIRHHIELSHYFLEAIQKHPEVELLAPTPLNLVCFRLKPSQLSSEEALTRLNATLMQKMNASGKVYLTHTKLNGIYTLRVAIGQTHVQKENVDQLLNLLWKTYEEIKSSLKLG
ncbi:aminotransferase class V-fold PLP-dependent enzyme [Rapidithrix thailandica]|uniref:Aminotransferase class V-fold PLP-dependent enzyme n=1 Tax=Rapidithrix thailandica TaxID=413964 RepID=A0AAW9SEX3_9BACT